MFPTLVIVIKICQAVAGWHLRKQLPTAGPPRRHGLSETAWFLSRCQLVCLLVNIDVFYSDFKAFPKKGFTLSVFKHQKKH